MGNFSRDTFNKLKDYVGVRLQQGVPLVDADWNELEDIRKYELETFIRWFVGNGIPLGNDGFRILPIAAVNNDFVIQGGNGTADGAGRCLVEGHEARNPSNIRYLQQVLPAGAPPLPALTIPAGVRVDLAYLDVWEREVTAQEDTDLVDQRIGLETSVRVKRQWAVRVAENRETLPAVLPGHVYYPLARLLRKAALLEIEDLRQTGVGLAALTGEIADARGMKGNLGNRLDESLTAGGQLRQHIVGKEQFNPTLTASYGVLEGSNNRAVAQVAFTEADANGAARTINIGFRPRLVWSVGYSNGKVAAETYGTNTAGYADLRGPVVQKCSGVLLQRYATAPFWRQAGYASDALFNSSFFDHSGTPKREWQVGAKVSAVSDTGITVVLDRTEPTTAGRQGLQTFKMELSLLFLG